MYHKDSHSPRQVGTMQRRSLVQDLLGAQQLKGKSFYLDGVKSRRTALLVEAIARFEGKVESFLNKDVSFVISGSQEAWHECQSEEAQRVSAETKDVASSSPVSAHRRHPQTSSCSQRTATPRPAVFGSRGKALLEKAIRNNERYCGSSVLANARSWGVKIVHVDDFLWYIDRLTVEAAQAKRKNVERKAGECPAPWAVKAGALKLPYLKIEDSSRKCRPLYLQSMKFPMLDYTGRFSPFEPPAPPPPQREKDQGHSRAREGRRDSISSQEKLPTPLLLTPSPRRARKKTVGYCECCQLAFKEQDEHLKSDQHRGFVQNSSHYSVVDQLVALLQPGFADSPVEGPAAMRLPLSPALPLDSSLELDTQVHSETEKAIQALLSQGSPPWLSPHPARVTLGEQDRAGSNPTGPTAPPVSAEQAEADPVPLAASTPGSLLPGHQHSRPETGSTHQLGDSGTGSKLPVEGGWPVPGSPRSREPPEEGGERPVTLLALWPSLAMNPRKRSRASSLSPNTSKRQRTTRQPMSDPALACPSISEYRRAPGHTPSPPWREPPSAPVPPSLAAEAPRAAEPRQPCQHSDNTLSRSHSSVFIEAALLPDPAAYSPSSSESDWECGLLSRLVPAVPPPARGEQCLLDLELLQRPCTGMQDTSYESRLCSVLQPPTPPPSLCGEDTDPALYSRTLDSCLEACGILGLGVQH
ncbi:hypothetical protein AAFF_G00052150 [Aldrovandia affinis]|uniref:DBF4-type domain-containing protein n=1 Tax=Aldrovandia affinis TaxID=143900 RepID=A0AAD7WZ50_9TELE|nr:hypothetical protein AAFF_G00052150 [Aldrovandia affinis]